MSIEPNFAIEQQYNDSIVAGVDEAGRGPLAGPVVAAAVIVNQSRYIEGVNDSKKLSKLARERLYNLIMEHYTCAVAMVSSEEIDKINILESTKSACCQAIKLLDKKPKIVLIDGNMKFAELNFISIIKGDTKSYSIAAASILAKVTRDRFMESLSNRYPEYGWKNNSGYGTKQHISAINKYGITPYHRKTFAPIKNM